MIEEKHIKEACEQVNAMGKDELEEFIDGISVNNQEMVKFTLSTTQEFDNEMVSQFSLYYFSIIYQAFVNAKGEMPNIEDDNISEYLEEYFYPALDELQENENQEEFEKLIDEPKVMDFLSAEFTELEKEEEQFDEAAFSQLFILSSAVTGIIKHWVKQAEQ